MVGLAGAVTLALATVQPSAATAGPLSPLTDAWAAGDCARCHVVPKQPVAERLDSCADCHVWIQDIAANPAKRKVALEAFPLWERYEKNVASYLEVPNLQAAMDRLEPAWVDAYLHNPHDVRPALPETMPRFQLTDGQIAAIAGAFAARQSPVPATPKPSSANVDRGQQLMADKGCLACHSVGAQTAQPGIPMAPDLQHTRARMHPDRVVAWIQDPKSVSKHATMPSFGIAQDEAIAMRDYLFLGDLAGTRPAPAGPEPTATTDPVTWAQVEERVFGRICVHCHMDPAQNQGRAGPGNAGGFGYPATGIELQTPQGVCGAQDKIPAALMRRRHEAGRDVLSPGESPLDLTGQQKPGMPLGLPPLSDADISLVLGWFQQGCPE